MDSPAGYLAVVGAAVIAALIVVVLWRFVVVLWRSGALPPRRFKQRRSRPRSADLRFDLGFPGLGDFASAHGWSGPRDDLSLDREEIATVFEMLTAEARAQSEARARAEAPDPPHAHPGSTDYTHMSLAYACTGHYRGMSILVGNALISVADGAEQRIGVAVVTLPYLLPRRHAVQAAAAVVDAIDRRTDWTIEFASGRMICVRHQPFESVADLARTLDGLADVVNAVPADVVARFTVVLPRLPDGRLSDPHDAESLDAALAEMTPAERAVVLDQMRGLRRSKPR